VYCSSNLFAEVCAVSLTSLFENNRHLRQIAAYIIDDHISEKNRERLNRLAAQYGRELHLIPLPDPSEFFGDPRFTIRSLGHTYARMILGDILPEDMERVISLDSDTLALGPVDALWKLNLLEHPIAGVDDCMGRVALVKTQHLKPDAVHGNAGMFLIDLAAWRRENWTEQFHRYITCLFDKGIGLGGYEEEVINHVLGDRMLVIHPRFNLMTLEQVLTYKELLRFRQPVSYYTQEEILEAKQSPVFTHTTNFFYIRKRVFEAGSDHPMRANYRRYRSLSPWKDDPAMSVRTTFKQKLFKNIWHCMPRGAAIGMARFVRNEIRPRLEKKRDDE